MIKDPIRVGQDLVMEDVFCSHIYTYIYTSIQRAKTTFQDDFKKESFDAASAAWYFFLRCCLTLGSREKESQLRGANREMWATMR